MLPIPFGNPYTYPGHSGVDFPQKRGTPFRASGPGVVTAISYSARAGHTVWVRYDNGPTVGYVHMDSRTTDVRVGQRVDEGTILGRVGSLGLFSTGPHLHAEIHGAATTAGFWRHFTPDRVVGAAPASGGGSNPLEEIMAKLDNEDRAWLEGRLSGYFEETFRLLKVPGTGYSYAEAALNDVRGVAAVVAAIRSGDIKYFGTNWNAFETLTNVMREDDGRDMSVPDVDEAALAAALAPSLAPLLADHLGTLSDETLEKIAKRSADEQARRLAS